MNVDAYLARIGYRSLPRRDLATLTAIHRAHLDAIPYENLDIHLGRTLPLGAAHAFDKLVSRKRGGWCYEMNGLLAAALEEIGFKIVRAAGAVHREKFGDQTIGNHLVMIAHLDRPYLIDVGFGDGPLDPIPLVPGRYKQGEFELGLERAGDWWRFQNHEFSSAKSFDFTEEPRTLDWFQPKCTELQTSEQSNFTKVAVLQRRLADRIYILRDCAKTEVTATGPQIGNVESLADYVTTLKEWFGLDLGTDAKQLWSVVEPRHRRWLAAQAVNP